MHTAKIEYVKCIDTSKKQKHKNKVLAITKDEVI